MGKHESFYVVEHISAILETSSSNSEKKLKISKTVDEFTSKNHLTYYRQKTIISQ